MSHSVSRAYATPLKRPCMVSAVVTAMVAVSHVLAPLAAAGELSVGVMPLALSLSGADLHILDEVVVWEDLGSGQYGATITPRWLRPDPILSGVVQASLSLAPDLGLVGEGAHVRWEDGASHLLVAPPPSGYTLYEDSVFLWDGDYRFPTRRQIGVPNISDPSGYSPIEWTAGATIGLTSGFVGIASALSKSSGLDLSAQVGVGLLGFYHRFDRLVGLTAEVIDDVDEDGVADDYFYNEISLKHAASSDGTAFGPSIGLRLAGQFVGADIALSIRQGWVRGAFTTASTFTDVDNIKVDYNSDGTWDALEYLSGTVPFRQRTTPTISTTTMAATLAVPLGSIRVGASAYYALYRGVPVSPDFSYRDLTVKPQTQDIAVSGLGAFVAAEF